MDLLIKFIVCFIAGAGIGTGFECNCLYIRQFFYYNLKRSKKVKFFQKWLKSLFSVYISEL